MILDELNRTWLQDFTNKYGRRPRVLHIGNIANNAYNNARLMNTAGLDCDVLCYDYYHIMGCPEWEDANFSDPVDDDFRPDWSKLDLGGYTRPTWFVQGPLEICFRYFKAVRGGDTSAEEELWRQLLIESKCLPPPPSFLPKLKEYWIQLSSKTKHLPAVTTNTRVDSFIKGLSRIRSVFKSVATKLFLAKSDIAANYIYDQVQRRLNSFKFAMIPALALIFSAVSLIRIGFSPVLWVYQLLGGGREPLADGRGSKDWEAFQESSSRIIEQWKEEYPDRTDILMRKDLISYYSVLRRWRQLLVRYDFVIGYSTDPIYPMLCGIPYFAFEHGTIREIPYQKDGQGRLTALAYRKADHVFVTNFDCVGSADYLAPGRYSVINHPYDEDHGEMVTGVDEKRADLQRELKSDFIFFHPTRQDWVPGTGYADKANDQFLRAFGELRRQGYRVGLVCCSWGQNVSQTRKLLDDYGCTPYVKWVSPLAIIAFERMCLASDVVVDQFKLGAFGGILFKAMAVGAPILTYLDVERVKAQYPETPPVINCLETKEIVIRVAELIEDRERLQSLSEQGRAWIKCYHSKRSTINTQVNQFRLSEPIPVRLGLEALPG